MGTYGDDAGGSRRPCAVLIGGERMLNWSNGAYKLTLGIGSLAMTAIMADLWKSRLPFWAIGTVAMLPFLVFIFVRPGELSAGFVRGAHVFAAAWYVIAAAFLAWAMF